MEQLIIKETISDILHNIARISSNNVPATSMGPLNGKLGMAIFFITTANVITIQPVSMLQMIL